MKYLVCFLLIINLFFGKVAADYGCEENMRLFGPNNKYRCNCKELAFCDFRNNGKCRDAKCEFGHGGSFCQKILYDQYLSRQISTDLNIFTNDTKIVKNNFQIIFNSTYRINQIRMTCKTSISGNKISVSIGNTKFCEMPCSQTAHCVGDITGENMSIKTHSDIGISNMEMTGCSPLWFGENCDKQCHCASNSECHQRTGNCPMGCESGRSGSGCQRLNYVNVALNKDATQTTTHNKDVILVNGTCKEQTFPFSAKLAVDGNTDQNHQRLSCMHTQNEYNPKWKVDLGQTYKISQIRIYNRDSENSDYLIGFQVYVGDQLCETLSADIVKASKIIDIVCKPVLQGNFVEIRIGLMTKRTLHICEVEVLQCLPSFYGNRCNNSCPECKNSSCDQWNGKCLLGCAPGYKQNRDGPCTADNNDKELGDNILEKQQPASEDTADNNDKELGDNIWEKQQPASEDTEGCGKDMRKFGPNDQYRCNCKELAFCDFKNNGKCRNAKCKFGYRRQFCQKILYHEYLSRRISQQQNVFTNDTKEINNALNITFKYLYRIRLIKINCQSSVSAPTISLYIGSTKFCEKKCQELTKCKGDAIGKYLLIKTTSKISLSNMNVSGCSPFWFGEKCDKQCHCANNSECHKWTGKCPMGCESGRSGSDCQTLNYVNVALNKTASQSDTYPSSSILINNTCMDMPFSFSAKLAVDGNTDQQFKRRSCTHTNSNWYPHWEVDLGKKYNILQMRIYNRNTQIKRLDGTRITVDDKFCYYIRQATNIIDIKCNEIIHGRTIKIEKRDYGLLHICEVEVLQCLPGFYGNRCNNSCPECKNSSCDQWDGHCRLGCELGYQQHPNNTCTACPVGTFGEGCNKTCHCKNNNNCNKENGTCGAEGCEAGYKGHNCQDPCAIGTFGEGCSKTCHCINNSNCNKKNGTCGAEGCAAGYKGHTCQEFCPIGTFDVGCSQICRCKNNKYCNKENGICGAEGCGAGYKGHKCQENCSVGTFGEGCSQKCHCKDNNNCNKENGTCGPEGCKLGYKGHNCQQYLITPIIIGLSVILIIVAGLAIYFKVKRSKKKEENTSLSVPNISLQENMEMDSVVDNDDNDDEEDIEPMDDQESIYMNNQSLQTNTMEITKDNILSYVKNKKMEDLPFAEEFLKLPKGLLYAHNTSKEEKNKSKNRYKTIVPYDHSRVRLHPDEHSSSDYINANYLTENKSYIATQGPLNSTIIDFWRMVYQTKCSIIVMLTNLSENGKLKSEQYWPDVEMTTTYGIISVSHKRENKHSYYTYRQFCITKNSEKFWVEHYQFTSWPDHGAPKEPEYFIAFRNKIRSMPLYKPPIIVHCSAGVGRSGSYIVLDIILEEMKNNSKIDVIGCILKLRKDRTLMVQNRSQLEYIYDVLVENIATGSTMIYVHKLPQVYNQLLKFPDKSSTSFMKLQFEKLVLPFNTAINNCSNKKDTSMIYNNEQYVADDENDVNPMETTTLNGNNLEEEFILISTPSEEKIADFWSVVFLKRCTLLVMFDNMPSEEAVYWPQKKDLVAEYKHFVVKLVDEHDNDYYIKRTMKVSSSMLNMPELLVHQFQFRIWLETDFPSPNEMVEIIQTIHSSQISQSTKQITLHCLDGISKNGLFCVLYMMIEILQRDSLISIVQLIRLLKRKNKEIISDYMSYHYCWLVAKVFLEELSLYSNVSNSG